MVNRRGIQRFRQVAAAAARSVKIKLALGCCIAFTLFALAGLASRWTRQDDSVDRFSNTGKGYAVLINTWKRYDLLKQSISHYSSCGGLNSIHIVWSEPEPPSGDLKKYLHHVVQSNSKGARRLELKFDLNKEDSLNNRFKEIKDLKADAVFSIDDDVIFPCSSVEFAFTVWQSAKDTMVGFVPRAHWIDKSQGKRDNYVYGGWWSVWWSGTYSMVLSKAAFSTKSILAYTRMKCPHQSENTLLGTGTVKTLPCPFS